MVIGMKKELETYKGLNERLVRAIDFVLSLPDDAEEGEYEIDGRDIYATVTSGETKPLDKMKYEAHRQYIDLQYVIKGGETVGYAHIDNMKQATFYNEEEDIYFMEGDGDLIHIQEGGFYIVYPFDAHAPCLGETKGHFKKLVVKIKI